MKMAGIHMNRLEGTEGDVAGCIVQSFFIVDHKSAISRQAAHTNLGFVLLPGTGYFWQPRLKLKLDI